MSEPKHIKEIENYLNNDFQLDFMTMGAKLSVLKEIYAYLTARKRNHTLHFPKNASGAKYLIEYIDGLKGNPKRQKIIEGIQKKVSEKIKIELKRLDNLERTFERWGVLITPNKLGGMSALRGARIKPGDKVLGKFKLRQYFFKSPVMAKWVDETTDGASTRRKEGLIWAVKEKSFCLMYMKEAGSMVYLGMAVPTYTKGRRGRYPKLKKVGLLMLYLLLKRAESLKLKRVEINIGGGGQAPLVTRIKGDFESVANKKNKVYGSEGGIYFERD